MGSVHEALDIYVRQLNDIRDAITFVREKKDDSLWEKLISDSLTSPQMVGHLLAEMDDLDHPLQLISSIPLSKYCYISYLTIGTLWRCIFLLAVFLHVNLFYFIFADVVTLDKSPVPDKAFGDADLIVDMSKNIFNINHVPSVIVLMEEVSSEIQATVNSHVTSISRLLPPDRKRPRPLFFVANRPSAISTSIRQQLFLPESSKNQIELVFLSVAARSVYFVWNDTNRVSSLVFLS
jgi:hypothetical protein